MAEDNKNNEELDKQEKMERATQNNADAVRTAADVAGSSGHPVVAAVGKGVKVVDKVTGGRSSALIGKGIAKANNAIPGGKLVQGGINKLNESKVGDAAKKAAAAKGGDKAGAAKGAAKAAASDVGKENLKKSLANKNLKNASGKYQGKKFHQSRDSEKKKGIRLFGGSSDGSSETGEGSGNKKKHSIILIIILFAVFFVVILFISIIHLITSLPLMITLGIPSMVGNGQLNELKEQGVFTADGEYEYYQQLSNVGDNYKKRCNEDLGIGYIHSVLIYPYYFTSNNEIDYRNMASNMQMVLDALPSTCGIDYTREGDFYNNLKNSQNLRNYYSEPLKTNTMDEILESIFEIGEAISLSSDTKDTFVSEDVKVNVENTQSSSSSNSSSNNSSNNETKNDNVNVTLKEYLLGITYASIKDADINNSEVLKAYVIAHLTNIVAQNKLTNNTATIKVDANSDTLYCNPNKGCSYVTINGKKRLQEGSGETKEGNNVFYSGKNYYLPPNSTAMVNINNVIEKIYGYILVNNVGQSVNVDISKIGNVKEDTYQNILKKAYPELTIQNVGENTYTNGVIYGSQYVLTQAKFYEQTDYNNIYFCNRKNNLSKNSIGYAGCGVTAMAIVISTYKNSTKYDPVYMNQQAASKGYCNSTVSTGGTYSGFFCDEAKAMGYKCSHLNKNSVNPVVIALSQGNLVIVNVGRGIFTNNGHYIVLGGIDPTNQKVYVYDPYNRVNKACTKTRCKKSGNGWYDLNTIVGQVNNGYWIIYK